MIKENQIIFSVLNASTVNEELNTLFAPSKNRLKKYFAKNFLEKKLRVRDELSLPIDFVNELEVNPCYEGPAIEILFEDENFIVLDKPSNIFVHPLTYSEKNNCLSYLRANNLCGYQVNTKNYDRGLLYRLDFETSGVLILVKSDELYKNLRENFSGLIKEKIYLAKVSGECKERGSVISFLRPHGVAGAKMLVVDKPTELKAELEIIGGDFNLLENTTVLKIKLTTGHRHQIRTQLSSIGFPIIGDELYGGVKASRLWLHAYQYQINLNGLDYLFKSLQK